MSNDRESAAAQVPRLAVGGIAFDGDRVLLIERRNPPAVGQFTIPGGKVEFQETLADALRREFREETRLEVDVGPMVTVIERIVRDGTTTYHYVIIDYLVTVTAGELQAGDDAAAARWVSPGELVALRCTDGLRPVLAQARELHERLRSTGHRGTGEP